MDSGNPFVLYRERLDAHAKALGGGLSDQQFVDLVERLDTGVAAVDGHGFTVTPVVDGAALATAAGLDLQLTVKVEVDNVAGSHKARHLFGVALHLLVDEALGAPTPDRLAIASCGNAALAAAVVARAMDRRLEVFVPTWADPPVIERLAELGAAITVCPRRPDEVGDPCYLRFGEAVAAGARAFGVQGVDTPTAFDGGRTIGWELADQAPGVERVYVQVGGGGLATSVAMALPGVALFPVQAEGCAPLRRAWELLAPDFDLGAAEADPTRFMWAWDDPHSAATGILDDVTHDWLPLLRGTLASGGEPVVAPEAEIERAHSLVRDHTGLAVSATGTAGFAGVLAVPPPPGARVAVLFTGTER